MKKFMSLAVASALTLACFTSCTVHIKLDDKDTTSSYDFDYDYDYNSNIELPDSSSDTSSSYGEKLDSSEVEMKDSTEEQPLKVGEWGKAMSYTSNDPEYSEVGVTVTEVIRGDEARQMIIDAGYAESELDEKLKDGYEWAVLKYKVYCPEDFPVDDYGFYYTFVSVYPIFYSGNYKYTCFGTDISQYDVNDYNAKYIHNGEVGEGLCAFSLDKSATEVYVKFGSDPDYSDDVDEGFSYFVIQ